MRIKCILPVRFHQKTSPRWPWFVRRGSGKVPATSRVRPVLWRVSESELRTSRSGRPTGATADPRTEWLDSTGCLGRRRAVKFCSSVPTLKMVKRRMKYILVHEEKLSTKLQMHIWIFCIESERTTNVISCKQVWVKLVALFRNEKNPQNKIRFSSSWKNV